MITAMLAACAAVVAGAGRMDQPVGFLVVAPGALAEKLGPYVRHKQGRLRTELVTLEEAIKDRPGVDDAEKLKRALYEAWNERAIRYVLLVGDADVMPVRYMALDRVTKEAFDYAFYPSDLYYADVARADGTFDDWNQNKEGFHAGYFGEVCGEKNKSDAMNYDGVSYVPEIAIGRWPASTPAQVDAMVVKTVAYDVALDRGQIEAKAAGLVVGGWVDARGTMDGIAGKFSSPWSFEKLYYSDGPAAQATDGKAIVPPDEKNVVERLNGGCGLVLHAGHGSDDSWAGCFSIGSIGKLTGQKHPAVMMSAGCSTARLCTLPPYEPYEDVNGVEHKGTNAGEVFDAPPPPPMCYARGKHLMGGLGKALVRDAAAERGAVVYIGCDTGSQPCGMTLEKAFAEAIASGRNSPGMGGDDGRVCVGDCWRRAVGAYYEREHLATLKPTEDWYPASIFFQGMKFVYYGDPTAELPAATREK